MGWFLLRNMFGEFAVFPDSSLLGVFDKTGDDPAIFVVIGRDGRPCDMTVDRVWTYTSLADALDGLVSEKAEAMRIAMHGTVRNCRVCGCTDEDCRQCVEKTGMPCFWVEDDLCSACSTKADPPVDSCEAKDRDCPRLSPLQDGNHPEIEAHRQRLSGSKGDPMASAKALLARKDAKP